MKKELEEKEVRIKSRHMKAARSSEAEGKGETTIISEDDNYNSFVCFFLGGRGHYGPKQPRIQTGVLGHSLVRSLVGK